MENWQHEHPGLDWLGPPHHHSLLVTVPVKVCPTFAVVSNSVILFDLIGIYSDMDILREFLESSTVHGLSYISTAKVSEGTIHQ